MAFKWRHWGQMTGNLVCPIGPDTKLEAEATGEEVELWGLCVAHLDYDFKITKLEVGFKFGACCRGKTGRRTPSILESNHFATWHISVKKLPIAEMPSLQIGLFRNG